MAYNLATAMLNTGGMWAKAAKQSLALFSFEDSGADLAHTLSMHDWRDWLPLATPPFEHCLLEWDPRAYLARLHGQRLPGTQSRVHDAGDLIDRLGIYAHTHPRYGRCATIVQGHTSFRDGVVPSPYLITWDMQEPKELSGMPGYRDWVRMAFGAPYIAQYGEPPCPTVTIFDDYYDGKKISPENMYRMAEESIGQVRVALAALALLNAQKETLHVPASYRDGRTILRNRTVPRYRPSLVVIRPDAIRRVYDRSADAEPTGIRKREHDVRQHFRTLADGRRVRVRAHQRGDASLGRVEKRYIVEHSPEVIMPIEQPPVLD